MNHSQQQVIDDLEVFHEFMLSEGGPGVNWGSVQHGDEHKAVPDIVCRSACAVTYYELTQVDPSELHNLVARCRTSGQNLILSQHFVTEADWPVFRAKYRSCVFVLEEPEDSVHPHNANRRVFKYLMKHDPRIDYAHSPEDAILIPYDDVTPGGNLDLQFYRLHKDKHYLDICYLPGVHLYPMPSLKDPEIWHGGVASRNPAASRIVNKCENHYRDESGKEQLRPEYVQLVLWTDVSGFLMETTECLESAGGRSVWEPRFSSVWLFDRVNRRIACHVLGHGDSD